MKTKIYPLVVGWVEVRNPTAVMGILESCWVSLRSTQPTELILNKDLEQLKDIWTNL